MPAYQLLPACKDYLWGGNRRLREDFGVVSDLDPLAEAWLLSCHPDGPSTLQNGPYAGLTLPAYLERVGRAVLGTRCAGFDRFPLLVKLIDAQKSLSIQVHPSDAYAMAHEGEYGKTEMWVVLHADPGAYLYYGFERPVDREEVAGRIAAGTLTEILHRVEVQAGDVVFIPAGTLHAIGAGIVVAEIQQNSNVTYRVFDYGRLGADGKPRPLHVDKALEVMDLGPAHPPAFDRHLGQCPYFTVDSHEGGFAGQCGEASFHALLVTAGEGSLLCGGERQALRPGSCFFLPAGSGNYQVEGDCRTLAVYL